MIFSSCVEIHAVALSFYLILCSTAVAPITPIHPPSLAEGCRCGVCSGGLGPDEAEKGATVELSRRLPAPSPTPHIMNNAIEKIHLSFNSPGPPAEMVQSVLNHHGTAVRFLNTSPHGPTRDCLCLF